jgi:biopolymer transport protein ExbB
VQALTRPSWFRWFAFLLLAWLTVALLQSATIAQPSGDGAPPPSSAAGEAAQRAPQGFLQILFSGGPIGVVIMLVLIGLSLTAAYLVFENLMTIRRREIAPDGLSDEVRALVAAGRIDQAIEQCRASNSYLAWVMQYGLSEADGGWPEIEKAMEDASAEQAARLFRKIEYLAVLGNIAPMVGLLGTVVGMLIAFKEVADSEGNAGAAQLAEGIYQALVTTVAGLIIAIPSLGAFAIFRNRVDQFVAEASYAALHGLSPLKRSRLSEPPRSGPPAGPTPPPPPAGPPPAPPRATGGHG